MKGGISTDSIIVKEDTSFNTINGLQLKKNNFNGTIVGIPIFGFDINKFKYNYTAIGDVLPVGILPNDKPLEGAVNIANKIFYFKFGINNNYKDAYEALINVSALNTVVPVLGYYKEPVDAMIHMKVGSIELIRFYYKNNNSENKYFDVTKDTINPFTSNFSILLFNNL